MNKQPSRASTVGVDHYIPRNKLTGEGGFMHYQKALPPHAERVQPKQEKAIKHYLEGKQ